MARQPARARAPKRTTTTEDSPLDRVLEASNRATAPSRIDGVLIGRLAGIDGSGRPIVDLPHAAFPEPIAARSTVAVDQAAIGCEVAVVFEGGRKESPLLIGVVHAAAPSPATRVVEIDGERLVFRANQEIVLQCGKASITLTKAGKVIIRGEHLVSRSSGVNRIRGGSIHLN